MCLARLVTVLKVYFVALVLYLLLVQICDDYCRWQQKLNKIQRFKKLIKPLPPAVLSVQFCLGACQLFLRMAAITGSRSQIKLHIELRFHS